MTGCGGKGVKDGGLNLGDLKVDSECHEEVWKYKWQNLSIDFKSHKGEKGDRMTPEFLE